MRKLTIESLISGTVGALAMMPAGLLFRALGMRIGHYGPKFASLYLDAPGPAALFLQHLVLGWVSALPLCLLPLDRVSVWSALAIGALYGAAYYVAINALALPLYFGDPLPWDLGAGVVVPSLIVHLVFGIAVAGALRVLRRRRSAA
jgi:uncharacterized membrane protein YagU involved in acid resistance